MSSEIATLRWPAPCVCSLIVNAEPFSLTVFAPIVVDVRKIGKHDSDVGMIAAERPLVDFERTLEKPFRLA